MNRCELYLFAASLLLVFWCPCVAFLTYACFVFRWYIRGSMYNGRARCIAGKTVVITGGNTGIGKETARDMASRGANVVILCRDVKKGDLAAAEIIESSGNQKVRVHELDLASFESIRACAKKLKAEEPKIHILINNAGVMMCPRWETKDGLELQIGTNHFGHFLLTLLLLDNIKAAESSRIISVSSLAHKMFAKMYWDDMHMKQDYDSIKAYSQSKLANVLFTKSLAKKLRGSGVNVYSLHPGAIRTELARHLNITWGTCLTQIFNVISMLTFKNPVLGAQTTIACAIDEKFGKDTGKYYSNCKETAASENAMNENSAEKLWNISLETVGLKDYKI